MTPAGTLGLRCWMDRQRLVADATAEEITGAFPAWDVTVERAWQRWVFHATRRDAAAVPGLCALVSASGQEVRAALLGWEFPGWIVTADRAPVPGDPGRRVIRAVIRDPATVPDGGIQVVISPSVHEVRAALSGEREGTA